VILRRHDHIRNAPFEWGRFVVSGNCLSEGLATGFPGFLNATPSFRQPGSYACGRHRARSVFDASTQPPRIRGGGGGGRSSSAIAVGVDRRTTLLKAQR